MAAQYKANEIASLFIQLANGLPNNHIDNLKLNKLCYYAQGWHLARYDKPLFQEDIQAWDYGPVIPEVYRTYKACGGSPIQEPVEEFDESNLSAEALAVLTDVYMNYGRFTSAALIDMTHRPGTPWERVYEPQMNHVISTNSMRDYFVSCREMTEPEYDFSPEHISTGILSDEDATL